MTLLLPTPATVDEAPAFTAVTYQRVSTKEQAAKGGRDEGFSIPAQREANTRKAQALVARVVAEFVDAGESARSADRPDLKRMLDYISSHQVTYCIVHKVDRLARNRLDDVEIHRALIEAGVTLVSATENIDETPSGMLLHGIMSSIAEFYSKNLATEVTKGLTQKVATGGTPMRAPIGYLNVRKRDEQGREYRTVEVDPERAPFIQWVFEQYATGEHTVIDLFQDATARGLVTVPTPQRPSGPVGRSTFFKILRNPYYIGLVPYKGATHPGTHEPLIDVATWQRVQSLLDTAKEARARKRTYDHYLKGSLFCGACGSRMQLDLPKNKQGIRYAYFACTGRRKRTSGCTRRAVPVAVAERLVADCYSRISISETQYADLAKQVEATFDERFAARSDELPELTANRRRLEDESDKILAAHFADAIDLDTLKRHQDRIRAGLADIDRRLAAEHDHDQGPRKQIARALRLLVDCQQLYNSTDAQGKRLANQTFTNGINIDEDEEAATLRLSEPFTVATSHHTHVRHVTTSEIVEATRQPSNPRSTTERLVRAVGRVRAGAVRGAETSTVVDVRGQTAHYRTRRVLAPAEADAVVQRFREGETIIAIARDLQVDRRRVRRLLYECGVAAPPVRLTAAQIEHAAVMYCSGSSLADVAARLGVSAMTIRRRLVEHGVEIRPGVGGRDHYVTSGRLSEHVDRVMESERREGHYGTDYLIGGSGSQHEPSQESCPPAPAGGGGKWAPSD